MKAVLTRGPMHDRGLDISVGSSHGPARVFAPTWDMVLAYKRNQITAKQYMYQYTAILCKLDQSVFYNLAKRDRHLKCYCPNGTFCHTYLLIHHCVSRYPHLFTTDEDTRYIINQIVAGVYTAI